MKDEDVWIQAVEETKEEGASKERKCLGLNFQVADAKKPLIAVKRITEKGNYVALGENRRTIISTTRSLGTR